MIYFNSKSGSKLHIPINVSREKYPIADFYCTLIDLIDVQSKAFKPPAAETSDKVDNFRSFLLELSKFLRFLKADIGGTIRNS